MFQIVVTPAAGKRLIAKSMLSHQAIGNALQNHTIAIIAGSTNGYIAEELLLSINQHNGFSRERFFRGITLPPERLVSEIGRLNDETGFPGDVIITKGVWQKGKTIYDVVDTLTSSDLILKGANCIDKTHKRAGILIGHPKGGTITTILQAVIGKRVQLLIPSGLEKRIADDIDPIVTLVNQSSMTGHRMMPVTAEIVTEIEAIGILFEVKATLIAAGGVGGAEGAVWLALEGNDDKLVIAKKAISEIAKEKMFSA
jgi:hypothetical protein